MRLVFVLSVAIALQASSAFAFEKLDGYFIAEKVCEAFQSKNKQTNPGNINTVPRTAYTMIGINKAGGDYFQVKIEGAPVTVSRWVSTSCGVHVVEAGTGTAQPLGNDQITQLPNRQESTDNLLTLSWQPAFCEIRPGKQECQDLNQGNLQHATRQLSIHGLWPQPKGNDYCGVSNKVKNLDKPNSWKLLPEPALDPETKEALEVAMPGFASGLHFHEWIKHGTCYFGEGGADEYYRDTLHLTDTISGSAVGDLFFGNIGKEISGQDIRDAFDQAFGTGAGQRVQVKCTNDGGRNLVNEIWISLKGKITPDTPVSDLLLEADPVHIGCRSGIVDPAGLQ